VPRFEGKVDPLPPPPQPAADPISTRTIKATTVFQRNERCRANNRRQIPQSRKIAISYVLERSPGKKRRPEGVKPLAAWVLTVNVTGTVVADEVKANVEGLNVHVLSGGKFVHRLAVNAAEPVKPLCAVNVRVVDPDCPGLVTEIVVGFATIANGATLTEIADDVDPLKLGSPLYCAVILSWPNGSWLVERVAVPTTMPSGAG
jgi:hypothetical protein